VNGGDVDEVEVRRVYLWINKAMRAQEGKKEAKEWGYEIRKVTSRLSVDSWRRQVLRCGRSRVPVRLDLHGKRS